jgi:hypothetical protein
MKCPHCEYIDGYDDDNVCHDGEHGNFWYPEMKMRREEDRDYYDDGKREAYMVGCPSCKKCFIHEL